MGMSNKKCYLYGSCKCQTAGCVVLPDEGCPVYRYFKDLIVKDYEARLKADMVDMLDKIRAEIEFEVDHRTNMLCAEDVFEIIDKFKEKEDTTKACTTSVQQLSKLQQVRQKTWAVAYDSFKEGYEARLKADMVDMLTDIQSEIRHFMYDVNPSSSESDYACNYMIDSIQQRINALKENADE